MTIDKTNDYAAALNAIKETPIGESGQFQAIPFFRDARSCITVIRDGKSRTIKTLSAAAAELCWLNLNAQKGA
ncbi:MAG: hypothetical protein IPK83_18545 [Planctomycetes bacterium]|nr:hypothetical protein [Planctomycetota bacterium]